MLEITPGPGGELAFKGRFDASQVERAQAALLAPGAGTTLDFKDLDYISSAGLGILLAVQKALAGRKLALRLLHLSPPIRDVFKFSGFDQIFEIVP
jgi:anti-sigma B factor antagonist